MKNYSLYQKPREVNFSRENAFPAGLVLIAVAITYGLYYFLGIGIALFFNVFISWGSYFYIYYYGKGHVQITFDFLKGVIIILTLLLFADYGVYTLAVYQKTGMFNRLYFQIWILILIGTPAFYYLFQYGRCYLHKRKMVLNYLKVSLKIHHDRELLLCIDDIQFINTSKRTVSDINLEKESIFYLEDELKKMKVNSTPNYYSDKSVFNGTIHMPFNTNLLLISWYSIVEDKYYDIKLPFPFDKMSIEREKYPTNVSGILRGKKTKQLHLTIHPNGGIRLFNSDTVIINQLNNIPSYITEQAKNEKIKKHCCTYKNNNDFKAFSDLVNKIKISGGIEERFIIHNKLILWSMHISGLDSNNYFNVFDVSFHDYESEKEVLELTKPRFLPTKIEVIYRGDYLYRWLILKIDTQSLYQSIQKLTDGDNESSILIDLAFEYSPSELQLKLKLSANGSELDFTDWEIQIDKDRKQSMDDHLLDKNEDETKRSLLKEAWALTGNKQYALAQEKCNVIFAIDPRYSYAYYLESRLLWYQEGFDACYAKRDYFIAKTKHEPSALAHVYNNYGCLLDIERRYEESKFYFEKAIESYPKEGLYVCNLAEMYCKLKEPRKAMELAEKSKKLGYESETLDIILKSFGTHNFTN